MVKQSFFLLPPAPSADLRPELSPGSLRASRVPTDGDRESGFRLAGTFRRSEQPRGAAAPQRDADARELPPLVREVTAPVDENLPAQTVALTMIVILVGIALGTWAAAVMEVWP